MGLLGALSDAITGLVVVHHDLGVVSQNIANANTPGYIKEVANQESVSANGVGEGVAVRPTTRAIDTALQAATFKQAAAVANWQRQSTSLQAVDAALGTPGSGTDLASLLGAVEDRYSNLLTQPDNQAAQNQVVAAATMLTRGINALGVQYTEQRQGAQNDLVNAVASLSASLTQIGQLSDQMIAARSTGASTADLENRRDTAVQTISQLLDVRTLDQPNGDMLVLTSTGLQLPTRPLAGTLSAPGALTGAGAYYPGGGIPGVTLNGVDITSQLLGGRIGGDVAVRDRTMPTFQAELDEFAYTLSTRFAAQGLTLFTDPSGQVPSRGVPPSVLQGGYVGYGSTIQVNPAILSTPSLVRDGTDAITGDPNGATAFTPNPPDGPAGFSVLIKRVLNNALSNQVQTGVPQPPPASTGLGAGGTLRLAFVTPPNLSTFATQLVSSQSQASADAAAQLGTEQAVQTTLNTQMAGKSGVDIDAQMALMVQLQNAYGANSRIIAAVESMWSQLLDAVH